MGCGADTEANELIADLTTDVSFEIPAIDLDSVIFKLPGDETIPMYGQITPLTNADLTTGEVSGSGSFDALMRGFKSHLTLEFEKGRITGAEYAKAYTTLTQNAMAAGVQFLLGRDQAYWASQLAQLQAITALVQLENTKVQLAQLQLEALNSKANYALTKMRLSSESMNYCISKYNLENTLPAQKDQILQQTQNLITDNFISQYQLSDMLPTQKAQILQQTTNLIQERLNMIAEATRIAQQTANMIQERLNLIAEETRINQQTTNMIQERLNLIAEAERIGQQTVNMVQERLNLIAEAARITQQTENLAQEELNLVSEKARIDQQIENLSTENDIQVYNLANILPKNVDVLDAEIAKSAKDLEISTYNLSFMLPKQLDVLTAQLAQQLAETDISEYNLANLLPAQLSKLEAETLNTEQQTDIGTYQLTYILPKQLALTTEQVETQRSQTLNTRTDGSTIAGSVGKQKDLYSQQITSYQRDAEVKAAKMFTDAWITQKTIDEGLLPPTGFTNASLDDVLSVIKFNNGF